MKWIFCVGLGFALVATISLAADVPTNSVTARIESSSVSINWNSGNANYWMKASCKFSFRTMVKRVKQPILKLIICYERGDGFRYLEEYYSKSAKQEWGLQGGEWLGISDIAAASKNQTEVESSSLQTVFVKNECLCRPSKGSKILVIRTELWFDGNILCADNPQNKLTLEKLGLPEDWCVKGKYPDKIRYNK